MPPEPALFLDRDGVIVEEAEYLSDPAQLCLIPGAGAAIARVNARGIPVIVVTNQAGVARGYFPEERVGEVHERLSALLAAHGAHIDRYYYCPHHPTAGSGAYGRPCSCRKPEPGMLLQAARDFDLDLARSFLVGDKISDLEAGLAAGCRTILVGTGYGRAQSRFLSRLDLRRVALAKDIGVAVDLSLPILSVYRRAG
jgi:D-glycero-D-manno-heptose 1,7-bisphosphate phosphatase